MNKLIENKLRRLVQKEIKHVLKEGFDFEDYDDTELDAMHIEVGIDTLIETATKAIDKEIAEDNLKLKREAMRAIKKLWIKKINQWI